MVEDLWYTGQAGHEESSRHLRSAPEGHKGQLVSDVRLVLPEPDVIIDADSRGDACASSSVS